MFAVRSVMHRALATLISLTFGLSTFRREVNLALNQPTSKNYGQYFRSVASKLNKQSQVTYM